LLGVTVNAVRVTVKRHGLAATGRGPARRLPRATVEALARNAARGAGPKTVNHYVQAVRSFFRWLVAAKRIGSNPLDLLSLTNTSVDVRRARRELTAGELRALFAATRASRWTFRGLTGEDRFHLYLTAAATGFRASALANLTPADFDLDADTPTVALAARINKSRKPKVQPVPGETAEQLRAYLGGRPAGRVVWGGPWASDHRGAEMLRGDLEAAGIPYAVEGPDGPEYADFHSLRHS
jgi:integrase